MKAILYAVLLCLAVFAVSAAPLLRESGNSQLTPLSSGLLEHAHRVKRRESAELAELLTGRASEGSICDFYPFPDICPSIEKKGSRTTLEALSEKLKKERSLKNSLNNLASLLTSRARLETLLEKLDAERPLERSLNKLANLLTAFDEDVASDEKTDSTNDE